VADTPQTQSFKSRLGVPCTVVHDVREVYDVINSSNDPIKKGKELLFLTRNMGPFMRDCPGTKNYSCCGYRILHIGTYCHMDCSYCILQSYFHPPLMQYFMNHDDMFRELDELFNGDKVFRIGTGEFTDSLIWESWTDLSKSLIDRFSKQSSTVLELKTKTTSIKKLKRLTHNRKTVVSWSLNTERVIRSEERRTASLTSRFSAASECEKLGYPVAFHFDPLILYEDCEKDYLDVLRMLFSRVPSESIVWISMGSFRFMPSLKPIIQKRFSDSKIIYGEFISGLDNKMRYFKPLRISLYQTMVSYIREIAPDLLVYFCMEDDEVWEKTFGFIPADKGGLPFMLDRSAIEHCGLIP